MGWQAIRNEKEWLQFDLGEVKEFNRLDLYPAGNGSASGVYFPQELKYQYQMTEKHGLLLKTSRISSSLQ